MSLANLEMVHQGALYNVLGMQSATKGILFLLVVIKTFEMVPRGAILAICVYCTADCSP